MERKQDQRELSYLMPRLKQQQQAEDFDRDQQYKQSQIDINAIRPDIMQQDADTRAMRAVADAEYKDNLISLGTQKANDVRSYREAIIELRKQGVAQNDRRILALEERIKETIRHNKATEAQQKANEDGRNTRAANTQAGIASRSAGVADRAKQRLSQMNEGQKKAAINKAVDRWMQQNKGATPEQIAETRQRLIDLYQ